MNWKYKKGNEVLVRDGRKAVVRARIKMSRLKKPSKPEPRVVFEIEYIPGYRVLYDGESVANWIYETDVKELGK